MALDPRTILLIDGNNLWHAMRASDIGRAVGRHRLVEIVSRSVTAAGTHAVIVFDGARPRGSFARQMQMRGVESIFSGARTADEVLLEWLDRRGSGVSVTAVTDDRAVAHGARARRASVLGCNAFLAELIDAPRRTSRPPPRTDPPETGEQELDAEAVDEWLREFGFDDDARRDDDDKPYWQNG